MAAISSAECPLQWRIRFFASILLRADNLHVNRRGNSEIQNLRHDIRRLKEENLIGKPFRQVARQSIDIPAGRPLVPFAFSAILISPSAEAHQRAVAEAEVDRTVGNVPILSRIVVISSLGISCARWPPRPRRKCGSVSSSHDVPGGLRTCRRIWPASTLGKKSRPIKKNNPHEPTTRIVNPPSTIAR